MSVQIDLKKEIKKRVKPAKHNLYLYHYYWIKIKSLALQTTIIFIFQYLTIIHLPFSFPGLTMYPPIGMAFVMFYLLGNNAWIGMALSSFLGYAVKGLPLQSILLYLISDLGCGYLGAFLSRNTFSTDIRILLNWREVIQFIKINTLITCLISGFVKTVIFVIEHKATPDLKPILCLYINLWLADLNAVLILSATLFSWVYVPFSRDKISSNRIEKRYVLGTVAFIAACLLFIKNSACIYLIVAGMLFSIYLCLKHGHLIGVTLLFILSTLYLVYFIGFQYQRHLFYDPLLYTAAPLCLLIYAVLMFYFSHITLRKKADAA